jgi:hypothetical protein
MLYFFSSGAEPMNAIAKQQFIRAKALERKIKWSGHALSALTPDELIVAEVELALQQAEVIEDYPHAHRYLPDCLVLAFSVEREPIHAVVATNEPKDYALVVTVYRPTAQEWQNDWRTRR